MKNLQNKSSSLLNISNFFITIIINYIFEIGRQWKRARWSSNYIYKGTIKDAITIKLSLETYFQFYLTKQDSYKYEQQQTLMLAFRIESMVKSIQQTNWHLLLFPIETSRVQIEGVDFVQNAILVWPREKNVLVLVDIGISFQDEHI